MQKARRRYKVASTTLGVHSYNDTMVKERYIQPRYWLIKVLGFIL